MTKYLCNHCRIDPFVRDNDVRRRMNDMLMMLWFVGEDSKRLGKSNKSPFHCHFSLGI